MDNRWKFLYCVMTEHVGTRAQSAGAEWKAARKRSRRRGGKSPRKAEGAIRTEKQVGKRAECVPRKAAIVHNVPVP